MQFRTESGCLQCGNTHYATRCPAEKRKCYKCAGYGHYGKVCHSKKSMITKAKSEKKKIRDHQRLQEFIARKCLVTELPFNTLDASELSKIISHFYSHTYQEVNNLKQVVSDLQVKNVTWEKENDILVQKLHLTRDENFDLSSEITELKNENAKINKQKIIQDSIIQELKVEIQNLEEKTRYSDQLCSVLNDELIIKDKKLCELTEKHDALTIENKRNRVLLEFPPYVEDLQERLRDLHNDLRQKDARVKQLENELSNTKCRCNTNKVGPSYSGQYHYMDNKEYRRRRGQSNTYRGYRRGSKI